MIGFLWAINEHNLALSLSLESQILAFLPYELRVLHLQSKPIQMIFLNHKPQNFHGIVGLRQTRNDIHLHSNLNL